MAKHGNEDKHAHRDHLRNQQSKAQLQINLKRRIKTVSIWGISIAAIVLVIWGLVSMVSVSTDGFPTLILNKVASTDHWAGTNGSKVLIVEYSDFQCPACAQYNPIVKKAIEEKGDKFQFVYRNFPLKQIHANAVVAARAAEAAALQGDSNYWAMNNLLFERQTEWEHQGNLGEVFATYASQLGMDSAKFKADYVSAYVAGKVENDYLSGMKYKVAATPTFYMNGQPIKFSSYEELSALIDRYSK